MIRRTVLVPLFLAYIASAVGCASRDHPLAPVSLLELTGSLTGIRDDRPVDGDVALTLEFAPGTSEVVFVPSLFRGEIPAEERERILRMHAVVDALRLGDRLFATVHRDETGRLIAESLAIAN
jgi:hypothetical protein